MKFENLNDDLFKKFEKSEIGDLGKLIGGKKRTQSDSTGWWCNDSTGSDQGPWEIDKKDV